MNERLFFILDFLCFLFFFLFFTSSGRLSTQGLFIIRPRIYMEIHIFMNIIYRVHSLFITIGKETKNAWLCCNLSLDATNRSYKIQKVRFVRHCVTIFPHYSYLNSFRCIGCYNLMSSVYLSGNQAACQKSDVFYV